MSANSRQIAALMDSLASGRDPLATELALLSDLDAEDAERIRQRWTEVPARIRELMLTRSTELAEDNLDLQFDKLARIALDDPEPSVRRAAIECAWESSDRHIAARLAVLLREDEDEVVRGYSATALGAFVLQSELEAFDRKQGEQIIESLRAAATDPAETIDVRARAIESLGYCTRSWVDTLITDAYYHDDNRLHLAAIHAMGASAQEKWIDYLADEADSDNPENRYEVAVALGNISSEEGIETLANLLHDEDSEVQMAAIVALGEIGGEEAVRHLNEFIEQAPGDLQALAIAALDAANLLDDEDDDPGLFRVP